MTSTYSYSVSNDFSNGVDTSLLHQEIVNSSIVTELLGMNLNGDDLDIVFSSALSAGEVTTLDALVDAHDPDAPGSGVITEQNVLIHPITLPIKIRYKSTNYLTATTFIYIPSIMEEIIQIKALSYVSRSNTTYYIRLYDNTNHNVLTETSLTNTGMQIINLNDVSNLPTSESMILIQVKASSSSARIYLNHLLIYYK